MSLIGQIGQKALGIPVQGRYEIVGGQMVPMADNISGYVREGYNANDLIYSVVNIILEKIKMAPWAEYKVKDESSLKQLKAVRSKKDLTGEDARLIKNLHTKALELVTKPSKWNDILAHPNDDQSFQDLVAFACGYKMLTGNGFLWADLLDAGANTGYPQSLWVMPSQDMMIKATRIFPSKVTGYQLNNEGWKPYTVEEVMHFKYPNFSAWDISSQLWGMAPLKAACMLTNQMTSADKSATAKYQNGGLQHIIFIDEPGLSADARKDGMNQMAELKKKLINEYSGPDNSGKIAGTSYKVGAVNLGLSPADLQIIEAQKWGLRRFCNIFGGVPSQTLNDPDNKVYANMKEGEVALTTRGALPHLSSFAEAFNRKAHSSWKLDKDSIIDYDTTVYSELQDDKKEMSEWCIPLAKQTGMSPNRLLDLLGLERIDDEYYDQPRVLPEMGEAKSDFDLNVVDQTLNDGETGTAAGE